MKGKVFKDGQEITVKSQLCVCVCFVWEGSVGNQIEIHPFKCCWCSLFLHIFNKLR